METWNNINLDILPLEIKNHFRIVKKNYEEIFKNIENLDDKTYLIRTKFLSTFKSLCYSGELNVDILPNLKNEDPGSIIKGFELASPAEDAFEYYKIKNEAYLWYYLDKYYKKPFLEGYNEELTCASNFHHSKDRSFENKIFGKVYNKNLKEDQYENILDKECYKIYVVHPNKLAKLAKNEGRFVKAWEIILENPENFIKCFESKIATSDNNRSNENINNKYEKYCWFKVAVIIYNGTIKRCKIENNSFYYKYKEFTFSSTNDLAEHISAKNILNFNTKTIRRVLDYAYSSGGHEKNIFFGEKYKILKSYFSDNEYVICEDANDLYQEIKKNIRAQDLGLRS